MNSPVRRWPLIANRPPVEPSTVEIMERNELEALVREQGQQLSAYARRSELKEARCQSLERAIGDIGALVTESFTAIQKEHIRITRIVMRTLRAIDQSIVSANEEEKEPPVQ